MCANADEAQKIAQAAIERRLAACVNIVSAPVRSVYRWQGRVESADEVLLVIKSSRRVLPALQRAVAELHSYDVPEFIALPIAAGGAAYLQWMAESLAVPAASTKTRAKGSKA